MLRCSLQRCPWGHLEWQRQLRFKVTLLTCSLGMAMIMLRIFFCFLKNPLIDAR